MRSRKRRLAMATSIQSAEVLECRNLLSATAIGSVAPSVSQSFVSHLAAAPNVNASTVPGNGDVNPYGVAFVPAGVPAGGKLHPGSILVSNFNNSNNLQGTGTTIVEISPTGQQSLFFQGPKGLGLSTALAVLNNGMVLVGNVPTTDGSFSTIHQGSLLILNKNGQVVANLVNRQTLDGPWDMTVFQAGDLSFVFVSNVLNGTVSRVDLLTPPGGNSAIVLSMTTIASGYVHRGDPAALAIGPTGLAFNPLNDLLYVAATGNNAIFSIPNALLRFTSAGRGNLVFSNPNLRGPLGLALLPDGNLITANGDAINGDPNHAGELVEFSPSGRFIGETSIDPAQGSAFGLAVEVNGDDVSFAAVNDDSNTLEIWNFEL